MKRTPEQHEHVHEIVNTNVSKNEHIHEGVFHVP